MKENLFRWIRLVLQVFGGLFLLQLLGLGYLYIYDPFDLRPPYVTDDMVQVPPSSSTTSVIPETLTPDTKTETEIETTKHAEVTSPAPLSGPSLTPGQENALRFIGIDPNTLPTEITETQRACFERALGEARVAEIVAGATPSVIELFSAQSCLE